MENITEEEIEAVLSREHEKKQTTFNFEAMKERRYRLWKDTSVVLSTQLPKVCIEDLAEIHKTEEAFGQLSFEEARDYNALIEKYLDTIIKYAQAHFWEHKDFEDLSEQQKKDLAKLFDLYNIETLKGSS